ncbi:hypothetical protein BDZ97DRAFT_1784905 [Flammula alnicola]|nr:hypothetical protein BDZ97DRAFT_1784905 [Flammula alnicola]
MPVEPLPTPTIAVDDLPDVELGSTGLTSSSQWAEDGFSQHSDEGSETIAELGNSILYGEDFGKKAFLGKVASDQAIEKRWKDIPEVASTVDHLHTPMCDLIREVLKSFGYCETRPLVDSYRILPPPHDDHSSTKPLKPLPHLMAIGSGINFGPLSSRFKKGPSYRLCISPIELQTEKGCNFFNDLAQIAFYARQCFLRQLNRKFVYSLLITEKHVKLYVFDRSGVYHSSSIDFHQDATDFVRLILGVCSPNDDMVGFDISIQWWEEDDGQLHRYLLANGADGTPEFYSQLTPEDDTVFFRRFIQGRGTCCWHVWDQTGEGLLLKDVWRSVGDLPEWEFLEAAKGLAGVGQMIAYEEGSFISKMRGIDIDAIPDASRTSFCDRRFCRMTLEDYGGYSLRDFTNHEQLLFAFRDAIAGHQNLWNVGILHCDISIDNILLGKPEAQIGYRGILIDLDMATWLNRPENAEIKFHNMVCYFFSKRTFFC